MIMDSNPDFKYTIYKTTNKVNGKVYIGCHKTTNPSDDYIGSGFLIRRAIRKYGRHNFKKEVLFVFAAPDEMFLKESEIVDRLFVESDETYNLLEGGRGGFDFINSNGKNLYGKNGENGKKNLLKGDIVKQFLMERGLWGEWKKSVSRGLKEKFSRDGFHWTGRKHRAETKRKIGRCSARHQKGRGNSRFGTCWIYSETECKSKSVSKDDLPAYLESGWKQGRKMNFIPVCKQVA